MSGGVDRTVICREVETDTTRAAKLHGRVSQMTAWHDQLLVADDVGYLSLIQPRDWSVAHSANDHDS